MHDDETGQPPRAWQTSATVWRDLKRIAREQRLLPTTAEARLWQALRGRQVDGFRFRRQHAIGRFIVDFYCSQMSLAIEVDGEIHEYQREADEQRTAYLRERGVRVIRFTNEEVLAKLEEVLERVRANLTPNPSPTSERGT
jgi:very-short-patch-repair endonuclease